MRTFVVFGSLLLLLSACANTSKTRQVPPDPPSVQADDQEEYTDTYFGFSFRHLKGSRISYECGPGSESCGTFDVLIGSSADSPFGLKIFGARAALIADARSL